MTYIKDCYLCNFNRNIVHLLVLLNKYVKKCMVQQSKIQGGVYDKEAFIRIFKIIRYIYLDLYLDF